MNVLRTGIRRRLVSEETTLAPGLAGACACPPHGPRRRLRASGRSRECGRLGGRCSGSTGSFSSHPFNVKPRTLAPKVSPDGSCRGKQAIRKSV